MEYYRSIRGRLEWNVEWMERGGTAGMTVEWWVNDKKERTERTEHVFPPTKLIKSQKQPDWRVIKQIYDIGREFKRRKSICSYYTEKRPTFLRLDT